MALTLVDRLILEGHVVQVIDNLSTGNKAFIHSDAEFVRNGYKEIQIYISRSWRNLSQDYIFHEAANRSCCIYEVNPQLGIKVTLI